MIRTLWHGWSVRTQLLVVVGAINLLAAFAAGAIAIFNTRMATRVEIEASLELAQRFVAATLKDLATQDQLDQLTIHLPLQLKHLRHVRIMLMDSYGRYTMLSPLRDGTDGAHARPTAPSWFAALVRPKLVSRTLRVVSVGHVTPVIIMGEPADEIAEAWQDFFVLSFVWLALNALILVVLYLVLGRVLDPLASISRGMLNLEDGDYTTRLKQPKTKELATIINRFNMLAGALDTARVENSRLYQQLVSVQEQERREIANELHDEAGPCLFGITANAASIKNLVEQSADRMGPEMSRRIGEILAIAERLKLMNRALLKKLRPGPLGKVELAELLGELIGGFQRQHPDTQIVSSIGKLSKSHGEAVDLTLYRCIQEGLTNAIRHGKATNVFIDIAEQYRNGSGKPNRSKPVIRLVLRDEGEGFAPSTQKGFGLTTMTERVGSLGGSCEIESAPSQGTTIRIDIPVPRKRVRAERVQRRELVGSKS